MSALVWECLPVRRWGQERPGARYARTLAYGSRLPTLLLCDFYELEPRLQGPVASIRRIYDSVWLRVGFSLHFKKLLRPERLISRASLVFF